MNRPVSYKQGFTLIELVLVTGILAVIGVAVYGTFSSGINVWKRIVEPSVTEDVNLFFEKISKDLRNSFKMTGNKFRGGRDKVSFPVKIKFKDEDGIKNSIGQTTYYFDRRNKTLNRRQANYSEIYRKKQGGQQVLARNIQSLKFEYFIYDSDYKKYEWLTSWQERDDTFGRQVEENLPLIVQIEVGITEAQGGQKFVKTVPIPAGCCWPFVAN